MPGVSLNNCMAESHCHCYILRTNSTNLSDFFIYMSICYNCEESYHEAAEKDESFVRSKDRLRGVKMAETVTA